MHDIYFKNLTYDLNFFLKITYFSTLIQNYDKFSKRNTKFDKIYTFLKIHIY
jgi:hypothetical protein